MKKLQLFIISIIIFSSCAQKVYFIDANKIEYTDAGEKLDTAFEFTSYFAGDAIDYLIFEMDLKNNSPDTIRLSFRDIEMHVLDNKNDIKTVLNPLSKDKVIQSLDDLHSEERANKRARDIGNAVDLGLSLLFMRAEGYHAVDAIFYSLDVAAIMMEDARAHKLLTGSIEEQKQYVNDWVLGHDRLNPGEEGSWDILFPRHLMEGDAIFILELEGKEYTQDYRLFLVEEKIMR